ncbi:MAG: hypothetical protein HPY79_10640 [Bacteroidales bacterium]|nr:hypothetical protein [Bacteroidales bacterium]
MPHFIDEAEEKEKLLQHQHEKQTVTPISEIMQTNKDQYLAFHQMLVQYIEKIATLSAESRRPVLEIGYTYLEGDFKFEYYASAYKTLTKTTLYFFKKEKIYSVWRRCIITISNYTGIVKLTLYEKAVSETNLADAIKKKQCIYVKIEDLNNEVALWLMDYLGYKYGQSEIIKRIPHRVSI